MKIRWLPEIAVMVVTVLNRLCHLAWTQVEARKPRVLARILVLILAYLQRAMRVKLSSQFSQRVKLRGKAKKKNEPGGIRWILNIFFLASSGTSTTFASVPGIPTSCLLLTGHSRSYGFKERPTEINFQVSSDSRSYRKETHQKHCCTPESAPSSHD